MDRVIIGGFVRAAGACACFVVALSLLSVGLRFGWGIGWMAWIPAAFLLLPALALSGRRELQRTPHGLEISDGRLFRRIYAVSLTEAELEILPAGGAWAVVLHLPRREVSLASWVTKATAERIAALMPELPRRTPRVPQGDR